MLEVYMNGFKNKLKSIGLLVLFVAATLPVQADTATATISTVGLPVVSFGVLLTFIIRILFFCAGLGVIIYGLMGGVSWITSSGDKENVEKARHKITAAFVGIFVMVFVLTIMWTLENIVFNKELCFGLSCDVRIPSLAGDVVDGCATTVCPNHGYNTGYCEIPDQHCAKGGVYVNPNGQKDEDKYCRNSNNDEGPCCCSK